MASTRRRAPRPSPASTQKASLRKAPAKAPAKAHTALRARGLAKPDPRKLAAKAKADKNVSRLRGEAALSEYRKGEAMERFRKEQPQAWLQAQRLSRVLEIQSQIEGNAFPPGCCFLHGNFISVSHVCVRQIREVNLETCQVTIEIHGDDNLEEGIVIIPLESVEWFGFPAKAVPVDVHFHGFVANEVVVKPPVS
ncbi:MAG TPA: hypothetical protein VEL07_12035 [Planctomycetota bacterium]|nr:hypothetical protein [Planctomycetota bacterium]